LHGYANLLKRLDTSESVNLHKYLILLDSCRIHATRWLNMAALQQRAGEDITLSCPSVCWFAPCSAADYISDH
jgi:hypothetical protein